MSTCFNDMFRREKGSYYIETATYLFVELSILIIFTVNKILKFICMCCCSPPR